MPPVQCPVEQVHRTQLISPLFLGPFHCIVEGWKQKVFALVIKHCMATNCINYNTNVAKIACIK